MELQTALNYKGLEDRRVMAISTLGLLVVMPFFCATVIYADQNRGTPEQREACTADAFRLCSSYIPDPNKVEICLRRNKLDLSASCRLVFDQNAARARRPQEGRH